MAEDNTGKKADWSKLFPQTANESTKILCKYCRKPIHIDDWGGVLPDGGFFHRLCFSDVELNWKSEPTANH